MQSSFGFCLARLASVPICFTNTAGTVFNLHFTHDDDSPRRPLNEAKDILSIAISDWSKIRLIDVAFHFCTVRGGAICTVQYSTKDPPLPRGPTVLVLHCTVLGTVFVLYKYCLQYRQATLINQ